MHNEPKVLFNPTASIIEFRSDGKVYIFNPGEHRAVDGFAAHIALEMTHTGLVEYVEGVEQVPLKSAEVSKYEKMSWVELRMKGAEAGFYKPGMNKEQVIQKLIEHDAASK